jgi:glycosyltransferase involved in cell wall biosynthesis
MIQFYGIFDSYSGIHSFCLAIARELYRRKLGFRLATYLSDQNPTRSRGPHMGLDKGDLLQPPPAVTPESIDLYRMPWGLDQKSPVGLLQGFYPEAKAYLSPHPIKVFGSVADAFPLPRRWVRAINGMDVVYVPSQWCKEGYKESGVDVELLKVPCGIDPEFKPPPKPPSATGRFRFLSTWSAGSFPIRKGFEELLLAWREVFRPGDGCQLVLRTQEANYLKEGLRRWCGDYRTEILPGATGCNAHELLMDSDADIVVVPAMSMYTFQYIRFIQTCHIGVFPARGGFEMDPMKAIACGLVTVVTRATGPADYADDSNSLGIEPCGRIHAEVHDISHGGFPGISMRSFIRQLNHARDNFESLRKRFLKQNTAFRERHSWSNVLAPLMVRLEELSR